MACGTSLFYNIAFGADPMRNRYLVPAPVIARPMKGSDHAADALGPR